MWINLFDDVIRNIYSLQNKTDNTIEIKLVLPKAEIYNDTKRYIAEELGTILYDVLKSKISPEILLYELNRYIPETRESKDTVKQLFREYFYSVVLYKERKPGIYPKFDAHMKQVLDMEFFKRIIKRYMESENGWIYAYTENRFKELGFNSKE